VTLRAFSWRSCSLSLDRVVHAPRSARPQAPGRTSTGPIPKYPSVPPRFLFVPIRVHSWGRLSLRGRVPACAGCRLRPSGQDGQVGGQAARDRKSAVRGPATTSATTRTGCPTNLRRAGKRQPYEPADEVSRKALPARGCSRSFAKEQPPIPPVNGFRQPNSGSRGPALLC